VDAAGVLRVDAAEGGVVAEARIVGFGDAVDAPS
jgi:hypothetical protein